MPPGPTLARRERERELARATRTLFDERGMQEAPIEEIAKAAGIARGLIYRQFASKEELYVFTVTDYLAELDDVLRAALAEPREPEAQLEAWTRAYAGFCLDYPASWTARSRSCGDGRASCGSCCRTPCGCGSVRASPGASSTRP